MPTHTFAGKDVQTDAEGFLVDAKAWSKEVGEAIAGELGIALTPAHWKVIDFARADTAERGESPGPRRIAAAGGVTIKDLYALFPRGPGKLVAKIAGVPKPKACI